MDFLHRDYHRPQGHARLDPRSLWYVLEIHTVLVDLFSENFPHSKVFWVLYVIGLALLPRQYKQETEGRERARDGEKAFNGR